MDPAPALPSYSFAPHAAPRFGVLVDRESSHGGIFVSFKHVRQPISTPAEFLKHLEVSLAATTTPLVLCLHVQIHRTGTVSTDSL